MDVPTKLVLISLFVLASTTTAYADEPQYHHPEQQLEQMRKQGNMGQGIYEDYCASCHAEDPMIPTGAPRIGHKEDWDFRTKKGIDLMFKITDEGLGIMPARGGCFECTDDEIKEAIKFMLPKKDSP